MTSFYWCRVDLSNYWRSIFCFAKIRYMPSWFSKLLEMPVRLIVVKNCRPCTMMTCVGRWWSLQTDTKPCKCCHQCTATAPPPPARTQGCWQRVKTYTRNWHGKSVRTCMHHACSTHLPAAATCAGLPTCTVTEFYGSPTHTSGDSFQTQTSPKRWSLTAFLIPLQSYPTSNRTIFSSMWCHHFVKCPLCMETYFFPCDHDNIIF